MIEYGVEWAYKNLDACHVGAGYTLAGAQSQVANSGDPKKFHPYAARVVERDVSDWREVETPYVAGDSSTEPNPRSGKIGHNIRRPGRLRQQPVTPGLTPLGGAND